MFGRLMATSAAIATGALIAVAVTGPAAKADTPTDSPVAINMSNLSGFADSNGEPISIVSDTSSGTQRTITGTETSGDPVVIVVYLNAPESALPSQDSLTTLAIERGGETTSEPAPDENPQSADTSNFVAQTVTASTPTTLAVAWVPPISATTFTLSVDGSALPASSTPNFTLTGLTGDQSYQLQMDSSYDQNPSVGSPALPSAPEWCSDPDIVPTNDLSDWDLSGSSANAVSLLGEAGLMVETVGDTTAGGAKGGHFMTERLADAGSPAIDWEGESPAPTIVLSVDFDGDGTIDSTLDQPHGETNWTLNAAAAQSIQDAAPAPAPNSSGSPLADWQAAFPSAGVLGIGYDQRNAEETNGVIRSLTIGCTVFAFRSADTGTAPTTVSAATSYVSVRTLKAVEPGTSRKSTQKLLKSAAATATADPQLHSSEVAYRTFIPYPTLNDSPNSSDHLIEQGCIRLKAALNPTRFPNPDEYTFIGDNRSFEQPNRDQSIHNFRTSMDFAWNWDESAVGTRRADVGQTTIVRKDDRSEIDHAFASTATMTFDDIRHTSDFATVTFNHVANDPFCPHFYSLGAISYQAQVSMYRSGLTTIWGDRFTMPSHETWVRWNSSATWSNALEGNATTLACLIGGALARGGHYFNKCRAPMHASITRSTDKWTLFNGQLGATQSGHIIGTGNAAMFAPHADGSQWCTMDALTQAASLPLGVKPKFILNDAAALVIGSDNHIYNWGRPDLGWFARTVDWEADPNGNTVPTAIDANQYRTVDTYSGTAFAVTTSGDVYTWGRRFYNTWGSTPPNPDRYETPAPSLIGSNITQVAAGDMTALALNNAGQLLIYGNLGNGSFTEWSQLPVAGASFTDVAIAGNSYYALDTQHRLWTWGNQSIRSDASNDDDPYTPIASPSLVTTDREFNALTSTKAVDVDGREYFWPWWNWEPNLSMDDLANDPVVPPVTLNEQGIDEDGQLWKLEYAGQDLEWVNYGRPPSRDDPQAAFHCAYPS